jgi:hypothetical protein
VATTQDNSLRAALEAVNTSMGEGADIGPAVSHFAHWFRVEPDALLAAYEAQYESESSQARAERAFGA